MIEFFWSYQDGCYIGACKNFISWAVKSDHKLYEMFVRECRHEHDDPNSFNCMDILDSIELDDFCLACDDVLFRFLISKLHTLTVGTNLEENESFETSSDKSEEN